MVQEPQSGIEAELRVESAAMKGLSLDQTCHGGGTQDSGIALSNDESEPEPGTWEAVRTHLSNDSSES